MLHLDIAIGLVIGNGIVQRHIEHFVPSLGV
jgi:hypothetical protein